MKPEWTAKCDGQFKILRPQLILTIVVVACFEQQTHLRSLVLDGLGAFARSEINLPIPLRFRESADMVIVIVWRPWQISIYPSSFLRQAHRNMVIGWHSTSSESLSHRLVAIEGRGWNYLLSDNSLQAVLAIEKIQETPTRVLRNSGKNIHFWWVWVANIWRGTLSAEEAALPLSKRTRHCLLMVKTGYPLTLCRLAYLISEPRPLYPPSLPIFYEIKQKALSGRIQHHCGVLMQAPMQTMSRATTNKSQKLLSHS